MREQSREAMEAGHEAFVEKMEQRHGSRYGERKPFAYYNPATMTFHRDGEMTREQRERFTPLYAGKSPRSERLASADAKDAERYRELRQAADIRDRGYQGGQWIEWPETGYEWDWLRKMSHDDLIDASVDAAIELAKRIRADDLAANHDGAKP